jgi:RHS repeat-associated protein
MPVTNYHTVNGRIIGETTGGTFTGYLTDALGSVTATVDEGGAVVNTYRYKPSGELLAKTGAGPDPKFRWNGTHGYRQTEVPIADTYIRARHYVRQAGQWTSCDAAWPVQEPYRYAYSSPVTHVDPSGLVPCGFLARQQVRGLLTCTGILGGACNACRSWCRCNGTYEADVNWTGHAPATGTGIVDSTYGLPCDFDIDKSCSIYEDQARRCPPGTRCKSNAPSCDPKGHSHAAPFPPITVNWVPGASSLLTGTSTITVKKGLLSILDCDC